MKTVTRTIFTALAFVIGALTCFIWPFLAAACVWVDLGERELEEEKERKAKARANDAGGADAVEKELGDLCHEK